MKQTICWDCKNATGGCSWSNHHEHKPVEGWEAIPTTMGNGVHSFAVLKCPKYQPHRGRAFFSPQHMDTDGAERLVQAICKKAVEDYEISADLRPAIVKFFRGEVFSRLSAADPEYIISMMKQNVRLKAARELRDMKTL